MKLAVFDYGEGTFDICVLDIKDEKTEVRAIHGDPECGGSNIDEAIFQKVQLFYKEKGRELSTEKDPVEWLEVLESCKLAKETLAQKETTLIPLKIGDERTSMELTCDQLNQYSADVIQILTDCCKKVLEKANLQASQRRAYSSTSRTGIDRRTPRTEPRGPILLPICCAFPIYVAHSGGLRRAAAKIRG